MPPKTYLRVRKRRNAGTALTLRLDGLEDAWNGKASDANTTAATEQRSEMSSRKRSAVWRRVRADPEETSEPFRVVDAILSESDEENQHEEQPCKRRRLTLVQGPRNPKPAKSSPAKKGLKILNPLERLVDESLQAVAVGTITPRQHYNFIWTDTRVSHQVRQWLPWRNAEMGTLLHAAAMWNDAELAADLLRMDLPHLAEMLDGEGRTAFEVAELAGNENVQEVMEAFGADTKNFVYDVYCLEGEVEGEVGDENQMACLLKNGMGYWTEQGELMLEREYSQHLDEIEDPNGDDEEDPNDEGWEGNDYPEEGYWVDNYSDEDDHELAQQSSAEDDGIYDYAYGLSDGADRTRQL